MWHRFAATVTGGLGGTFGLASLSVELPLTTRLLFRSIASIAAESGADVREPSTRLDCLTVFSHGGPSPDDDSTDSTYISIELQWLNSSKRPLSS